MRQISPVRPFLGRTSSRSPIRRNSPTKARTWSSPHNSFLQVGAELGIPALVVFITTILGALLLAGRLARDASARGGPERATAALARAQGALLVGYVVSGFFLSQAYAPFLYVSLGSIVGLNVAARLRWRAVVA